MSGRMVEGDLGPILEGYLRETIDFREEPAIVQGDDGVWRTLDGTPHRSDHEVAVETGRPLAKVQTAVDTGALPGFNLGGQRWVRQAG